MSRGRPSSRTPNDDAERHLPWFFNEAPGQVSGLKSSWGALEGTGPSGSVPCSREVPEHRLAAARRESDVASRLERLTADDRIVLSLAFSTTTPWPIPDEARPRLGVRVAPLLPLTTPAKRAFEAQLRRANEKADDREIVFDVREVDGRDAAWKRGPDPRAALSRLLRRGYTDWLYSYARVDDHGRMLAEACADARLALRRALEAWATVAPQPDADGRTRQRERRKGACTLELVRPSPEPIELFAPAWEPIAAE